MKINLKNSLFVLIVGIFVGIPTGVAIFYHFPLLNISLKDIKNCGIPSPELTQINLFCPDLKCNSTLNPPVWRICGITQNDINRCGKPSNEVLQKIKMEKEEATGGSMRALLCDGKNNWLIRRYIY
jgi:hypothetical protein